MRQLTERLDGWRDEQIALLERLVNHDSGTDDVMDVNRVGAILAERLRGLGFTLNRVATERFGDHLVAERAGNGPKRFLFVGHYDTVFPSGTDRKSTRLHSSHLVISSAVFCLKTKEKL